MADDSSIVQTGENVKINEEEPVASVSNVVQLENENQDVQPGEYISSNAPLDENENVNTGGGSKKKRSPKKGKKRSQKGSKKSKKLRRY